MGKKTLEDENLKTLLNEVDAKTSQGREIVEVSKAPRHCKQYRCQEYTKSYILEKTKDFYINNI